jgi:hypothetical protein
MAPAPGQPTMNGGMETKEQARGSSFGRGFSAGFGGRWPPFAPRRCFSAGLCVGVLLAGFVDFCRALLVSGWAGCWLLAIAGARPLLTGPIGLSSLSLSHQSPTSFPPKSRPLASLSSSPLPHSTPPTHLVSSHHPHPLLPPLLAQPEGSPYTAIPSSETTSASGTLTTSSNSSLLPQLFAYRRPCLEVTGLLCCHLDISTSRLIGLEDFCLRSSLSALRLSAHWAQPH